MIIITGGAGFIGSNLAAALEERNQEGRGDDRVVICDWLGKEDKWRNLSKRHLYHVVAPDQLWGFIEAHRQEISLIFHMGASSSTTEVDVDYILDQNYHTTIRLWEMCGVMGIRFIYASSAATYGDGSSGFEDTESPSYLRGLRPLNAYGWSKNLTDMAILQRVRRKEPTPPQWAGLKFFNVYGPNEYHKGAQKSVVATLFPAIQSNDPARLFKSYDPNYGDGDQLRDFIWVEDCVDVMLWLRDNPSQSGLFNVGTGVARSFNDLARALFVAMGKKEIIDYCEMPPTLRPKYQYYTQAKSEKLRAAGYAKDFTTLEEGVARYVANYLSHEEDPYR